MSIDTIRTVWPYLILIRFWILMWQTLVYHLTVRWLIRMIDSLLLVIQVCVIRWFAHMILGFSIHFGHTINLIVWFNWHRTVLVFYISDHLSICCQSTVSWSVYILRLRILFGILFVERVSIIRSKLFAVLVFAAGRGKRYLVRVDLV